jgi:hypothetical protein
MSENYPKQSKKKIWVAIIFVGLGMLLWFFAAQYGYDIPLPPVSTSKESAYFDTLSIAKWTNAKTPCIPIQIGDKILSAEIDLGFRGDCSLASSILDQIEGKTLLGFQTRYGFQGKAYNKKVFEVPNIRISQLSIDCPQVQEEAKDFHAQAVFVKDGGKPSAAEPARLGWQIFQNTNLLFDLKNEKIAFCDSLSTLKKQGYEIQKFVKAPLLIDRGLIEIEAETDGGTLRCMLDTGSTFNGFNSNKEENVSMQELFWNPEYFLTKHTFKINQQEFGPITFRQFPIRLPIPIDVILGMDFFLENIVFLDFANSFVYFCRNIQGNPIKE